MSERKSNSSLAPVKAKIKVVMLGDQFTGKTSILLRFMQKRFQEGLETTVGIDFMAKNMEVGNARIRLQLWDTAGQQRFRALIPSYLKDAMVTIVVFDLTNQKSFRNIQEWIQICNNHSKQKCIMIMVGNKIDLDQEREVSHDEAQGLAAVEDMKYFQVSAKNNINIDEVFEYAAQRFIEEASIEPTIDNIQNLHKNYTEIIESEHQQQQGKSSSVAIREQKVEKQRKKCC